MTASERLAALDAAIPHSPYDDHIDILRAALPEIVAVVKAAEQYGNATKPEVYSFAPLHAALAALDAKLEER